MVLTTVPAEEEVASVILADLNNDVHVDLADLAACAVTAA